MREIVCETTSTKWILKTCRSKCKATYLREASAVEGRSPSADMNGKYLDGQRQGVREWDKQGFYLIAKINWWEAEISKARNIMKFPFSDQKGGGWNLKRPCSFFFWKKRNIKKKQVCTTNQD